MGANPLARAEQMLQSAYLSEMVISGSSTRLVLNFSGRGQHFSGAEYHLHAVLVDARAVANDVLVVGEHLLDRYRYGDRVAEPHRSREM